MPVAKVALRAATAALAAAAGARAQDAGAPGLPALAANAPWWTGGAAWVPGSGLETARGAAEEFAARFQLPGFPGLPLGLPAFGSGALAGANATVALASNATYDATAGATVPSLTLGEAGDGAGLLTLGGDVEVTPMTAGLQQLAQAQRAATDAANSALAQFGLAIPEWQWRIGAPARERDLNAEVTGQSAEPAAAAATRQAGPICEVYKPTSVSAWTPTQSTIRVLDEFELSDVKVAVNATAPRVGALKIVLTSNSRGREPRSVILKGKGRGSSGKNLYNTVFVDEGSEFPAEPEQAPYTGVFAPQYGAMKKFTKGAGVKASAGGSAGIWSLSIEDVMEKGAGKRVSSIDDWELVLCHNQTSTRPVHIHRGDAEREFVGVTEQLATCPPGTPGCASNGHAPTIFEQEAEVTAQQAEEGPTSLFGEYLAFQADTEAAVTEFIDGLPSMGGFLEMVPEVWWRAMAGYLSLYYYMEAEITPSGNALSELLSSI